MHEPRTQHYFNRQIRDLQLQNVETMHRRVKPKILRNEVNNKEHLKKGTLLCRKNNRFCITVSLTGENELEPLS